MAGTLFRRPLVHELDDHRALADSREDALRRAGTDVARAAKMTGDADEGDGRQSK